MKINTQEVEHDVKLITLKGIIDEDSIDLVQGTFSSVFNLGSYKIICDMENVEHISAPVIKTFLENISTTQHNGGDLKLLNVHPSIQAIFRYAGFTNETVFSSDIRISLQYFEHISTPSLPSNGESVDPFAETIMPINKLSRPLQDHIQNLDSSHIEKSTINEQLSAKRSSDYSAYGETLLNIQDYMKDQTSEQTLRMIDPPLKNNNFNAHGKTLNDEFDVNDYISPKNIVQPVRKNTTQKKINKAHTNNNLKKKEESIRQTTPKSEKPLVHKPLIKKQPTIQRTTQEKTEVAIQKATQEKPEVAVQKATKKKQQLHKPAPQKETKKLSKPVQKQVVKTSKTPQKKNVQKQPIKNIVSKVAPKKKIARIPATSNKKSSQKSKFINATNQWNNSVPTWHKISINFDISDPKQVVTFIKNVSAIRSNVVSSVNFGKGDKAHVVLFSSCWAKWKACLEHEGYTIYPDIGGYLRKAVGKVIYCHSQRAKVQKIILVVPGVKKGEKEYISPVSTVILPTTIPFPNTHPAHSFPLHWRSILGELELLSIHARIQPKAKCAIESLTQKSPMLLHSNRNIVVSEIKKRKQTFERLLLSKTSDYKIATYYSPLEECFWSLYHDDRPIEHSFFDKIRKRIQEWHNFIKRKHQITVKNFTVKKDLKSIELYVEKSIVQKHPDVAKGKVVRQLCPALIVKANNNNRILKGRIISS